MSSSNINSKPSAVESNKKKGVLRTKNLKDCMLFIQNVHFVKGNENNPKYNVFLVFLITKLASYEDWLDYYYNNTCP